MAESPYTRTIKPVMSPVRVLPYKPPISITLFSSLRTDRKILDQLDGRKPEVTFSCNQDSNSCQFQFWAAQVESFYCGLNTCKSELQIGYDSNTTVYKCEKMQCRCVPGRFICGENGSVGKLNLFVLE